MPEIADKSQLQEIVFESLAEMGAEADAISLDATLEELDIDSLDVVELCQIIDEKYDVKINPNDLSDLRTVGQAIDAFAGRLG